MWRYLVYSNRDYGWTYATFNVGTSHHPIGRCFLLKITMVTRLHRTTPNLDGLDLSEVKIWKYDEEAAVRFDIDHVSMAMHIVRNTAMVRKV